MKKYLKVLIILLLTSFLVACGSSNGSDEGSTAGVGESYQPYAPIEYTYYVKSKDPNKEQKTFISEMNEVLAYSTFKDGEFQRLNTGLNTKIIGGFTIADGKHPMTIVYNEANDAIQREVEITVVKEPKESVTNLVAPAELDIPKDIEEDALNDMIQKALKIQVVTVEDDDVDVTIHNDLGVSFESIDLEQAEQDVEVLVTDMKTDKTYNAIIKVYTERTSE